MENIIYRKSILSDKERIEELFIEMLKTIYDKDDVIGYPKEYLFKFYQNTEDMIYVAEIKRRVIGFLSIEVHHEEEDFIYLDDFSVSLAYRGLGIGTKLMEYAEMYAKEKNIPSLYLHVERENKRAYQFYTRLGYQVKEENGNRYLMQKELSIGNNNAIIVDFHTNV